MDRLPSSNTPIKNTLSSHRPYNAQYQLGKSYYENLLLRNAGFLLKEGRINVVDPSSLIKGFPHDPNDSVSDGIRTSFVDCLAEVKNDQMRRKLAKAASSVTSTRADGAADTGKNETKPEDKRLREVAMYPYLVSAFTKICRSISDMRCYNVGFSRPLTAASVKMSPDLALSFDSNNGKHDVFYQPAVYIEVKTDQAFDIPFEPTGDLVKGRTLGKLPKQLLLQVLRYVHLGQVPELPWDYLYFITITGPIARIWKFTHTGCTITTPIRYLDSPDDLIRFTRALARNGRQGMGLSVGPDRLFTEYPDQGQYGPALKHIKNIYATAANNPDWINRPGPTGCWLLKVKPKDLFDRTGSIDSDVEYVVFKRTIHHVPSMFSRGTKCYLAIAKQDIEESGCSSLPPEDVIAKLRLLKTSWQHEARTHEADFFRQYYDNHSRTERPCGIPTLLASGRGAVQPEIRSKSTVPISTAPEDDIDGPEWYNGIDHLADKLGEVLRHPKETTISSSTEKPTESRRLDWLLFKEVGTDLSNARDSKELVQVLLDAVDAHESMCDADILHRDVSSNNILIVLSVSTNPRRGLLIDWEMAKDMRSDNQIERPSITGTLMFMSIALQKQPLHQPWHDLESVFWVSIYFCIRHVDGMLVENKLLDHAGRRAELNSLLCTDDLEVLSSSKRSLLSKTFEVAECPHLSKGLDTLRAALCELYDCFFKLTELDTTLTRVGCKFRMSSNRYDGDPEIDVENAHLAARDRKHLELIINRREELTIENISANPRLMKILGAARFFSKEARILDHAFLRSLLTKALGSVECASWISVKLEAEPDPVDLATQLTHSSGRQDGKMATTRDASTPRSSREPFGASPLLPSTSGNEQDGQQMKEDNGDYEGGKGLKQPPAADSVRRSSRIAHSASNSTAKAAPPPHVVGDADTSAAPTRRNPPRGKAPAPS